MKKTLSFILPASLLAFLMFFAADFSLIPVDVSARNNNLTSLPPIDWSHHHNYTEIVTILLALNETYSNIVDVFSIGKSWENRDIYCVRLTNKSNPKFKPEVFFVGYHHAREPISAELPLYFVVYAASNFGLNETVTELINKSEIYVVVALNVDGFDLFEANDWQRKNARPTNEDGDGLIDEDPPEDEDDDGFIEQLINYTNPGYPEFIRWEGTDDDSDGKYAEDWVGGVDLNRNYDYAWEGGSTNPRSEIYKGPSPFSEPETQAIRDFVLEHDFTYAISFHSGVELILYPWGHTYNPPPDEVKFIEIAQGLSSVTGGTPYQQASYLYFTHGVWDDWMYGVANVSALTCEIFYNETWEGVAAPGPYSNTQWEGGLKYWFNPFPTGIETTILRWLPVFFYITNRAIDEVIHNVAINDVVLYETVVTEGSIVEFNASVQNKGSFQETFNVNAYYDAEIIETREISLSSGASENLSLTWDTTGMAKDNYTISVYASPVLDETEMGDNVFYSWVVITILGDINGDKTVNILDAIILARAFGTRPGHHGWNSSADLNRDRDVNILDAIILATHFGETWV